MLDRYDYAKTIADAELIRTGGRWEALNAKITAIAANPSLGNDWYLQTLAALAFHLFREYFGLEHAHREVGENDISIVAWRARNLLELWVWALYCTKTKENARRFYDDAARDILNVTADFKKRAARTEIVRELVERVTATEQRLHERAALEGVETLDGSYKQVREAARECGIESYYGLIFKIASKFAHPTAMLLLALPSRVEESMREFFLGEGCVFFIGAFAALEKHFSTLTTEGEAAHSAECP
jgi:hypothetical protein